MFRAIWQFSKKPVVSPFANLLNSRSLVKLALPIILTLAALSGAAGWHFRGAVRGAWQSAAEPLDLSGAQLPKPDAERYATLKEEAVRWRK